MAGTVATNAGEMASALSNLQGQAQTAVDSLTKANQGVQSTQSFAIGSAFDSIRGQTNDDVNKAVSALTQLLGEVKSALNKVNSNILAAGGE
jgi:uncharacterized protein YukE